MQKITDRMVDGLGVEQDPKTLVSVANNIAGRTICALGEACAWPTQSFLDKFPEEFAAQAKHRLPQASRTAADALAPGSSASLSH
jgi:NADH-quinone oxidoreductase subunit F